MTTGDGVLVVPDAYVVPDPIDTDPTATVLETEIVADLTSVDIGGTMANAETYNGAIPGPTFRLNVGDTVIVRLVNNLPYPTGIHWHGIELQNSADGTPVTQDGARVGPFPQPAPLSPTGGTYLYKFKVPRPGVFWYHPHHFHSTNRVLRGLYGLIIVTDPNEAALVASGALPDATDTRDLVLSDITVCKTPGMNDLETYLPPLDTAEWLSGATEQLGPTPVELCETAPLADDGTAGGPPFGLGDIPNIQIDGPGRTVEGQTVLTNGVDVGGRAGTPATPGLLAGGAETLPVLSGQGLRLRIVNCGTTRYFRLRLTTGTGTKVNLVRAGGEGGLLDNAILEGSDSPGPGTFDFQYDEGEILLPPATRADVVAAIPVGEPVGSVLTLWARDFQRTGPANPNNWAMLPTVPVMHLNVTGAVPAPDVYTIVGGVPGGPLGTPLRAAIPAPVETLGAPTGILLDPTDPLAFATVKPGMASQDIRLTAGGGAGINGINGNFAGFVPYTDAPHIGSSRYAEDGETLELTVTNTSSAHHPFHLHGFSMQPISLTQAGSPTFTWPYREFMDVINVPSGYTLTFRVRLDDRELDDGVTLGGALGRWLFHCHIFFHAHNGMIGELVTTAANGREKPNVDVGGSWAYTPSGGTATRSGTFSHPDSLPVTLTAHLADGTPIGTVTPSGATGWDWTLNSMGMADQTTYVYITAEDADGRKDQAVFRLKIGGLDDGSDSGDPHIHTVDGTRYDFQAVGEFTLLRDREGMEIQTRQRPVATQNPITDPYSGLTACVSVNTAVAARVGSHRIAYQPTAEPGELQFYLDGKPWRLTTEGINLEGHRVSAFDADGATGLRVDYAHHAVLTVTPRFWTSHGIWYMNVSVSHTQGDEGIMGSIAEPTWLPTLPNGATVGTMPESLQERWVALYQRFANAWRVTDETSLFVYAPDTSTATFTDEDWPAGEPPCTMKPQFELPGVPAPAGIPIAEAEQICQAVTIDALHRDCVFDVATTGDEVFAKGYVFAQELRLHSTAVQVVGDEAHTPQGETASFTATVSPLTAGRPIPTGHVTFLVDGVSAGIPIGLDANGQARLATGRLDTGEHAIQGTYDPDTQGSEYHPSTSPEIVHIVEEGPKVPDGHKPGLTWVWILIVVVIVLIILGYLLFS